MQRMQVLQSVIVLRGFVETHLPLHYYQAKDFSASPLSHGMHCLHMPRDAGKLTRRGHQQSAAMLDC